MTDRGGLAHGPALFASAQIEELAWGLVVDSVKLVDLPSALFTFWNVAFEAGRQSREDDVRCAQHEADRLWLISFGDQKRRDYLLERLDQCAALVGDEAENALTEAWRLYVNSLANVREPIPLAPRTEYPKEVA